MASKNLQKPPEGEQVPVQFVYVHGTNLNTLDSRLDFERRVLKLHRQIAIALEKSTEVQTHLLRHSRYVISPKPTVFFWGDRSQPELEFLKRDLGLLQGIQTYVAGFARKTLAGVLHDAVWFERPKNKYRILKALHKTVMTMHSENQPIVLFGHSAGSLIVFNYMTYLLPMLDMETLLQVTKPSQDVADAILSANLPPTSALALIDSGAFRPDLSGRLMSTYQEPEIGTAYLSEESRRLYLERLPEAIRKATETSCLPPNVLQGIVTFGSPIPVFESDVGRYEDVFSLLVSYMLKYLMENGMIWLHMNHIKDPIGFPLPDYEQIIERIKANQGIEIRPQGGMVTNNSNIRGGATLYNAHEWYWQKSDRFAKELVKTYEKNYLSRNL